jgi:PadR family transcriptional regulator, regulatory protein PadR
MSDPISDAAARKGSAELLILSTLADGEMHGYELSRQIAERTGGLLTFHASPLYPLLRRLEERGLIEGRWRVVTGQRRRRCYRLTASGRVALKKQRGRWTSFIRALSRAAGLGNA